MLNELMVRLKENRLDEKKLPPGDKVVKNIEQDKKVQWFSGEKLWLLTQKSMLDHARKKLEKLSQKDPMNEYLKLRAEVIGKATTEAGDIRGKNVIVSDNFFSDIIDSGAAAQKAVQKMKDELHVNSVILQEAEERLALLKKQLKPVEALSSFEEGLGD